MWVYKQGDLIGDVDLRCICGGYYIIAGFAGGELIIGKYEAVDFVLLVCDNGGVELRDVLGDFGWRRLRSSGVCEGVGRLLALTTFGTINTEFTTLFHYATTTESCQTST